MEMKNFSRSVKYLRDGAHDFELFLRLELPWMLNLSPSKQVATEICFIHFADFIDSLVKKDSEAFNSFFTEFKNRSEKISKWRAPRRTKVVPYFYRSEVKKFPNGKLKYHLAGKLDGS